MREKEKKRIQENHNIFYVYFRLFYPSNTNKINVYTDNTSQQIVAPII